jgi:steroid 5-alpha reductase family enzyme
MMILAINFAILIAMIIALWAYAVRIRDVSFIDAFWAIGMVILAWTSWAQIDGQGRRADVILVLTSIWGLRLGWHLFARWRSHGEDPRYANIIGGLIETKGWSWPKTALLAVFLTQAPLLFITSLPAQIGIWASEGGRTIMGPVAWAGAMLAIIGILFDTGLWRYTRHPNYFGDACTWWGIWLVAAETGPWGWASVVGPLFLTFTLTNWSGKPLLERGLKKSRPAYAAYVARTSGFIPWPPKS